MPQDRKDRWAVLLAGLFAGCALPPVDLWPLALPGYALLLYVLRRGDRTTLFGNLLIFLLGAWGIPFHWVALHPIPAAAASSVTALLAYGVLHAAWSAFWVSRRPEGGAVRDMTMVLALSGFDVLLAWGPFAMPWLSPGLSIAGSSWALGMATMAGFHGVTLALLLLSMAIMRLFADRNGRTANGLLVLFLVVLPFPRPSIVDSDASLDVLLVEPGWSPEAWAAVDDTSRVARLAALVLGEPADLVIFPETALPAGNDAALARWARVLSDASGAAVLTGGIQRTEPDGGALNVAVSSDSEQPLVAKRRLVPFAERVPFSDWIPFFDRFAVPSGGIRSYARGTDLTTTPVGGVDTGTLICFESLFARDARRLVRAGADVLVVLTQDGWWGSDAAREQHAAFSRMLASATGSPVLHATVDGRTQALDATGRPVPQRTEGPLHAATMPLSPVNTPFRRVGDWPFFAIFGALLLTVIARRRANTPP